MKTLIQIDEELEGLEIFYDKAQEKIRDNLEEIWYLKKSIRTYEEGIEEIEKQIEKDKKQWGKLIAEKKVLKQFEIEEKVKE